MKNTLVILGMCVSVGLSAQTKKFSEIVTDGDTITTVASTDFLYVIEDPLGTPASKAVRASIFLEAGDAATLLDGTAWRVLYIDGSGNVTELALGADGTYLMSNGADVAPSFEAPAGGDHDEVTLAGTLDYITLSGQAITRGAIDLATDVTGELDTTNMDMAQLDAKYVIAADSQVVVYNAGVDVGLPYYGENPDIGAFEWSPAVQRSKHHTYGGKYMVRNGKIQVVSLE